MPDTGHWDADRWAPASPAVTFLLWARGPHGIGDCDVFMFLYSDLERVVPLVSLLPLCRPHALVHKALTEGVEPSFTGFDGLFLQDIDSFTV